MDAKVYKLINQISKELYSAYLYLSFADYYQEEGLEGFTPLVQDADAGGARSCAYLPQVLHENGCKVKLQAIDQPDNLGNHLEPLEAALEHEKYVTGTINDICTAALEAKDYGTSEVPRFVHFGAAEEDNAEKQVSRMRLIRQRCQGALRP